MSLPGQNIQHERFSLIPRTLCFIQRDGHLLMLRLPDNRGAWAGLLNGIGGHIQQGEDPLSSAEREIKEETGLVPSDLRLCGVIVIDTGDQTGISLFVFVGTTQHSEVQASIEGEPLWIPIETLNDQQLVEDLPIIIPRALQCYREKETFSATYKYDDEGRLNIQIRP